MLNWQVHLLSMLFESFEMPWYYRVNTRRRLIEPVNVFRMGYDPKSYDNTE